MKGRATLLHQKETVFSQSDFDEIASVLNLPRETFPDEGATPNFCPIPRKPWQDALEGVELSEHEIAIVKRCLPNGVPRRSRDDAQFLNACLAHQKLQLFGKSWWHLDPQKFGPVSSNAGRSARWDNRGWWQLLFDLLVIDGCLSENRMAEFAALAAASDLRRSRRHTEID